LPYPAFRMVNVEPGGRKPSPCTLRNSITKRKASLTALPLPKASRARNSKMEIGKSKLWRHVEGQITIGLYAINPATQQCKWVAIDADYKGAMEDLVKLQYYLSEDQVQAALEMSQRGGHLWIFLETPLLARDCRIRIHDLPPDLLSLALQKKLDKLCPI